MFKIRSILMMVGSAIAGIYLTSEEGELARKNLQKRRKVFQPIIKDIIKQANDVLDGSKDLNSTEIRANIEKVVQEVRESIKKIDLEKAIQTSREAIKVAYKKINDISNEMNKQKQFELRNTKKIALKKKATKVQTQTKIKDKNIVSSNLKENK